MRTIAILWCADVLVGVSYGAVAVALGFPPWVPISLAVLVVAGASEFLFISIVAGGGSPWLASSAGLLVNTRHVPYGFVVEPLLGDGIRRLLGIHILTDESLSFGLHGDDEEKRVGGYWLCGLAITLSWPIGTSIGALVGNLLGDPNRLGLNAVFPAALLALVVPLIRSRAALVCVIVGGALALTASLVVPSGAAELASLLAVVGVGAVDRTRRRRS